MTTIHVQETLEIEAMVDANRAGQAKMKDILTAAARRRVDRAGKEGVERRCWERRGTSRSQDGEGGATVRRHWWRQAAASMAPSSSFGGTKQRRYDLGGCTTASRVAGAALRGVGAAEVGEELKKHRVCETGQAWREGRSRIS